MLWFVDEFLIFYMDTRGESASSLLNLDEDSFSIVTQHDELTIFYLHSDKYYLKSGFPENDKICK